MKSIVEYIQESVFDKDLATKDMIVYADPDDEQHLVIDPHSYLWKECEVRFADILRTLKKSVGPDNVYSTALEKNDVVYMDKDCIVLVDDKDNYKKTNLTIISPETIYTCVTCDPDARNDSDSFGDEFTNKSVNVSYCYWPNGIGWKEIFKWSPDYGEILARIPETISNKAKNIIKKYLKPRHL